MAYGGGYYPYTFWRCRWFPWLPRWWWTGMYGPVSYGPYGPQLAQPYAEPYTPYTYPGAVPQIPKEEEMKMLEEQEKYLREQLEGISKRIEELKKKEVKK